MEYLKDFGLDGELNTTINKKMRRKSHRSFSDVKISGGLIRQFTYSLSNSWVIAPKKTKNGKVILPMIHILGFRSREHGTKPI
jgi:penicillin amidase